MVESAKSPVGGWVGGDSWFGSTTTAEVMMRFCVDSTWIIKQNQTWCPMKALFAVITLLKMTHFQTSMY